MGGKMLKLTKYGIHLEYFNFSNDYSLAHKNTQN